MDRDTVRRLLADALSELDSRDRYLLENDLSERCIASRLALHLQRRFADYHVDVEYNRDDKHPKRVPVLGDCDRRKNRDGDPLAVPDIIVHRRGPTGANLLVLELKKTTNREPRDCDRRRVQAFRTHLEYTFSALIECETRPLHEHKSTITDWFDDSGSLH